MRESEYYFECILLCNFLRNGIQFLANGDGVECFSKAGCDSPVYGAGGSAGNLLSAGEEQAAVQLYADTGISDYGNDNASSGIVDVLPAGSSRAAGFDFGAGESAGLRNIRLQRRGERNPCAGGNSGKCKSDVPAIRG